ncbi:ATP synthase H+ transporting, F1 complex, delta subunit precursor, putative [Ixodes scapularis]|uniref:ATP synthase H+ transporting, F1 complex, delta subunit, putative n=1 Tax=Ixodes scapularis TaxID=6945 RepID=B7PHW1_IXOSC|nr:ATP synthase H+ transporting, F1 complex, delta subunit precursor, putative [Ixodes scapularis]|eukprot:XP_002403674.1 ATP synthase H+ transporting, F1 complex, delta subunit precursor, putative [Ixodes scapularis]
MSLFRASVAACRFVVPKSRLLASQSVQARTYADGGMPLTFASPAETFFDKVDVKQVDVPSYSGNFGILPHHVPALAVIKPGVVTVFTNEGDAQRFFGTPLQSSQKHASHRLDGSSMMSGSGFGATTFTACREGLAKAQQAVTAAATDEARAEAQIEVEVHEALVKAVD